MKPARWWLALPKPIRYLLALAGLLAALAFVLYLAIGVWVVFPGLYSMPTAVIIAALIYRAKR